MQYNAKFDIFLIIKKYGFYFSLYPLYYTYEIAF